MRTARENLDLFRDEDLPQLTVKEIVGVLQQLRVDIHALDADFSTEAETALVYLMGYLTGDSLPAWGEVTSLWLECVDALKG